MLVSAVLPIMSIYRLPHGQYGYRGHIINLPQDVATFAATLPRCAKDLDVVIVRKPGSTESHHDFRVRKSVVLSALHWLFNNNIYYRNISLDPNAIAGLPEDGDLPGLTCITLQSDDTALHDHHDRDDPSNSFFSQSFVPISHRQLTEEEAAQQTVQDRLHSQQSASCSSNTNNVPSALPNPSHQQLTEGEEVQQTVQGQLHRQLSASCSSNINNSPPIVSWPSTGPTPVNEFRTEGYFTCAFPTLFPTGAADFSAPRPRTVTIGNYFKHLMMFHDGRFAKHPRFRYFALNTEMRWRALQTGQVYVRQHPTDASLSVQELQDMVGRGGEQFSNRVLHYASSLRGTRQYWFQQRSRLIAMVDTLGLPTIFFTHSAADLQWPELARLICPEDPDSSASRSHALAENPALADWFFHERIMQFLQAFYIDVLGATDYWLRFEWQHRGSPHVHGLAWLANAPDVAKIVSLTNASAAQHDEIITFVDKLVSTTNPAINPDGSNMDDLPPPSTMPHVCNKPYSDVVDIQQDLVHLISTCQRHTRCSPSYCLQTKGGSQQCRFGYPKPLQDHSRLLVENGDAEVLTARNDPLINSHNQLQLSAWRANVDMQYCVSRRKVVEYCAKYATKCEPRSQALKEVYTNIVRGLRNDDIALKAVQKLLINSVGERDYSAQETCHLLLQLPMFTASRDFIVISLDGSRAVQQQLKEGQSATIPSAIEHYIARPATQQFESMTLIHFVQHFTIPRKIEDQPSLRRKPVIVIFRPYCSPDPNGPQYEQYCRQKLMLYMPFRQLQHLLAEFSTFTAAYAHFLHSGAVPSSLEDDIQRLEQQSIQSNEDNDDTNDQSNSQPSYLAQEDWMLLCQLHPAQIDSDSTSHTDVDWTEAAKAYSNLHEMATFVSRHKEAALPQLFTTTADIQQLQSKQRKVYDLVYDHLHGVNLQPLHMIISGTAGTGKSYLINCLRLLLQNTVQVMAPTGVAAFNVDGFTLHSLLDLPTRGDFKELHGERLQCLQKRLKGIDYLIIDEMSMLGRKMFGQVDSRLRQAFPRHSHEVLGGRSCLLFGDFGQLPPVLDLPLYTTVSRSALSDLGRYAYQIFDKAIVLDQVIRQQGHDPKQKLFRDILLRLRDGQITMADWNQLMTQTPSRVSDMSPFTTALHLFPTVQAVFEHNLSTLRASGQAIATIKAVHSGPNASKASTDDSGGLEPIICIACGARVMLTSNLWTQAGLVNGAMGSVAAICYQSGGPPDLPAAVMVHFDSYHGPTYSDGTVPIVPVRHTWYNAGVPCSRLQLPLKLAWAITIHKAQGLTLDKVIIDVGTREFSSGLTFVACSRVRRLSDLLFIPAFPFQRLSHLSASQRLQERQQEDARLLQLPPNNL